MLCTLPGHRHYLIRCRKNIDKQHTLYRHWKNQSPRRSKVIGLMSQTGRIHSYLIFSQTWGRSLTTAAYHEIRFTCLIINTPRHVSPPQTLVWIPLIKPLSYYLPVARSSRTLYGHWVCPHILSVC